MATCVLLVRSQRKVSKLFLLYSPYFVCLRVRHKYSTMSLNPQVQYHVPEPIFMMFGIAEFLDLMQLWLKAE